MFWADFEVGKSTFITFGLANVETIRKNNSKKNIISFNEEVETSGLKCLFLLIFILKCFKELNKGFLKPDGISIDLHLKIMISCISKNSNNKSGTTAYHFLV